MTITGFLGALLFLVIGFLELMVFMRAIYPILSERYEAKKVTLSASDRVSPARIANLVRLQSLVGLPILGYIILGPVLSAIIGSH